MWQERDLNLGLLDSKAMSSPRQDYNSVSWRVTEGRFIKATRNFEFTLGFGEECTGSQGVAGAIQEKQFNY